jgi:tripartite-type tricarboxylate transporter receptor subunit TctC
MIFTNLFEKEGTVMNRIIKKIAIVITLLMIQSSYAQDANYPSRPITWITPMGAGGTSDLFARTIQPFMTNYLGQPMIVENKSGANGVIGEEAGSNAKPDGYTLIFSSASVAANPFLRKVSYDPKKFVPVIYLGNVYLVLLANNDVKAKNAKEFVEMARAKPPETYNYSSWGVGGMGHLASELFNLEANIKLAHIPYKSSPEAVTAAIAGQTQVTFQTTPLAIQQIKSGRLHALAIASPNRIPEIPDVPTMAEMGYPDMKIDTWFGIFLPPNTPRPIVDKLNKAFQAALNDPGIKAQLAAKGIYPKGGTPEEFGTFFQSEMKKFNRIVTEAKIDGEGK